MQRLGPLVHRVAHRGALLLIASAVVYLAGLGTSAAAFAGFSPSSTTLADLGNVSLSRFAYVFVATGAVAGVLGFVGSLWIRSSLPTRSTRTIGLLVLEAAFLAQAAFSLYLLAGPAGPSTAPDAFALAYLGAASLSMLILVLAMLRDPRWGGLRLYTIISGFASLGGIIVAARGGVGALSTGGADWIAIAPWLAWLIVAGVHLARFRVYAPAISAPPI